MPWVGSPVPSALYCSHIWASSFGSCWWYPPASALCRERLFIYSLQTKTGGKRLWSIGVCKPRGSKWTKPVKSKFHLQTSPGIALMGTARCRTLYRVEHLPTLWVWPTVWVTVERSRVLSRWWTIGTNLSILRVHISSCTQTRERERERERESIVWHQEDVHTIKLLPLNEAPLYVRAESTHLVARLISCLHWGEKWHM